MSKYLDNNGVLYFWQKIKATFAKVSHTHTTADVTGLDTALTNANKVTDVKVNGTSVVTNKSANITVDSSLSTTSNNPIKNSTVATKFNSVDSAISGKQDKLTFDSTPTANSTKPVTSGGVKSALDAKQDKLTFDSTPQGDSYNPVYSDGIYTALAYKQDELTFDNAPKIDSTNPVTSGGVKSALDAKQNKLTFDSTPTANSSNPVTSGGVKSAIDTAVGAKQNKLTFDDKPTSASSNPVTSDGIKQAIDSASMNIFMKLNEKQNAIPNADKLSIDSSGIIAAENLPSYVDDVIEVYILADGSVSAGQSGWFYIEREGYRFYQSLVYEQGKIYVVVGKIADVADSVGSATDAGEYQNTQWRWTGSQFVKLTDGSGVSPITNSEIDAIVAQ